MRILERRIVTGIFAWAAAITAIAAPERTLAQDDAGPATWDWHEHSDELTNAKNYIAALKSTNAALDMLGNTKHSQIVVTCSPDHTLFLNVIWPDFVAGEQPGDLKTEVLWKFDEGQIKSGSWLIANDHMGAFLPGEPASNFLQQAAGAQKLVIRITGQRGVQNAVFDLSDTKSTVQKLRDGCGIRLGEPIRAAATEGKTVSARTALEPGAVIMAARRVLETEGYKISSGDDSGSQLLTEPRDMRLTTAMADCGRSFGIPYTLDKRAKTRVTILVSSTLGNVELKSVIDGLYQAGYGNPDKPLTCVSHGTLEKSLLDKIAAAN